jgi:hypothetical protein
VQTAESIISNAPINVNARFIGIAEKALAVTANTVVIGDMPMVETLDLDAISETGETGEVAEVVTGRESVICKQVFHIVSGGGYHQRVPYVKGEEYSKDAYFLNHELRSYVEKKMPCAYGVASYDDLKAALQVLSEGVEHLGQTYSVLTGWVKSGDGATFVMTPTGIDITLEDLGIHAHLKSAKDAGKFMKYLKRLLAMYKKMTFGKMIAQTDGLMYFEANGKKFRVRVDSALPEGFKIEGCAFVSVNYANEFFGASENEDGLWHTGDTARITFTCSEFLWKGHVMVWDMNVDFTCWDLKKQISTDDVVIGYMGPLHAGDLRINIQPVINNGLQNFAVEMAIKSMKEIQDSLGSSDDMLQMWMGMFGDKMDQLDDDGVTSKQLNNWRLMAAIRDGFSLKTEPFMKRDWFRSFETEMLDMENFRILFPKEDGIAVYYFIDPFTIGRDGKFYAEKARLIGNYVYCPRLKQGERVIAARDPEAPNEWVYVTNALPMSGVRMVDGNVMCVSVEIMMEFVYTQGGGDFDDRGKVYRNARIVAHFLSNPKPYPPKKKIETIKVKISEWFEENIFAERDGMNVFTFDNAMLADLVADAMNADAGMGMIINWLMFCICLSLYKPEILAFMNAELDKMLAHPPIFANAARKAYAAKIEAYIMDISWMEAYVPFQEWDIANDLEGQIDGLAMNGAKGASDYTSLGKRIREFWASCRVVPAWAMVGGYKGEGRIPESCRKNNPSIVMTPICEAQKKLIRHRDQLIDWVNAKQWTDLEAVPLAIMTYPCTDNVFDAVTKARKAWLKDNEELREQTFETKKEAYEGFRAVCKKHRRALELRGRRWQMMFMAELERRVHDRKHAKPGLYLSGPNAGRPRPVADGYLNNPDMFEFRRMLWAENGLRRQLALVPLYSKYSKLYQNKDVAISVMNGVITRTETNTVIGMDASIPNGAFTMKFGTICCD